MTTIKIDDLRTAGAGTCAQARAYCRRHNINFNRLRTEGIPVSEVQHIQDQRSDLLRVIAAAEEREARGQ